MKARTHFFMFTLTILTVLALSAMQVVPVLADDEVPPPPAATEVVNPAGEEGAPVEESTTSEAASTEPPATDMAEASPVTTSGATEVPAEAPAPAEQVPAATAEVVTDIEEISAEDSAAQQAAVEESVPTEETPGEVLSQLPEGTDVVVLDENGETLPLVTQEAAEILYNGDPMWCPVGVTPGSASCSGSFSSINDPDGGGPLEGLINWLAANQRLTAGVIWIMRSESGNPGDYTSGAEGGAVVLDGVLTSSIAWMANYALTIKGGWSGTGTTIDTSHPTIFRVPLSIINWNANVTLSDIAVTSVTGDALRINTTKDISLTRVNVHNNNAGDYGARLDNTSGTGKVTITSSQFSQNASGYGLYVLSKGAITLTDVTAGENVLAGTGAYLNNSTSASTPGVILTRTTFSGNRFDGLVVYSRGLISAMDLTASSNGISGTSGGGATLNNIAGTAGVTMTGANIFTDNYDTGLKINSKGAITLNSVIANANDGIGYGTYLDNSSSTTFQPITLTGASQFKYNQLFGLYILSKGLVSLNSVNASRNMANSGVEIDNCIFDAVLLKCAGSVLGGVKITGTNFFNNNHTVGLSINSGGTLTLTNITAIGNGTVGLTDYGAFLTNTNAASAKPISLTGTNVFNGNYSAGLHIASKGLITISNLTASDTVHGHGAELDNSTGAGVGITLSGANFFGDNYSNGLNVTSLGVLTMSSITATGNGTSGSGYGIYLINSAGISKSVTLTGVNNFSSNDDGGLYINSTGMVKLYSVTANSNTGVGAYGIEVHTTYNNTTYAAVTVGGTNTFNDNNAGLYIDTPGIITLNSLNAARNGVGVHIDNTDSGSAAPRNVTLTGVSKFDSNTSHGLEVYSFGTITLTSVTATGNGTSGVGYGVYLDNGTTATLPRGVTLNGVNGFNGNDDGGLYINSTGMVKLNSVTANSNIGAGAYGIEVHTTYNNTTYAAVTVGGTNTFNDNNAGLYIDTPGIITLNSLNAARNGVGVHIDNTDSGSAAPRNVTLTGVSKFDSNTSHGLEVYSFGAITLTSVTATGNGTSGAGNGVYLDNSTTATLPRSVVLSGTNVFTSNYSNGLEIHTLGAITSSTLTASNNGVSGTGSGARLVQETGAVGGITLNGTNTFNGNYKDGLYISALGVIKINNLRASSNGHALGDNGAELNNASASNMAVTLTGSVIASGNHDSGLFVNSAGLITASSITASSNQSGHGAILSNAFGSLSPGVTLTGINSFTGNYADGLDVTSYGAINLLTTSLTANNNGLGGSSGFGVTLTNVVIAPRVPQIVKLTGTNIFNGNYNGGLSISTMGAITTSNLTANNNTRGNGISLTNTGDKATINLTGKNTFSNNYYSGMNIGSLGLVTISSLTANSNGTSGTAGYGVFINNSTASIPQAVNITGTNTFNGNYNDGLYVASLGTVTVNNLTADYNTNGAGAYIVNNMVGATGGVTLTGFTNTSENFSDGVHIVSHGNVSLTKLTADGNGAGNVGDDRDGLYANTTGSITITCGSLTGNGNDGLDLTTTVLTLKGVFSSGNLAYNINPAGLPPTYTVARNCPLP